MANDQAFKIKNGLLAKRYLQKTGTNTEGTAYYRLDSASYDNKSFDFSSQFTNDGGLAFNNDGTKMYIVAFTTPDAVYQYSLSTAYDVSTASYDSVSFDVSGQAGTAVAVKFNPSGTKMYIGDYGTDTTYQYSLSTAFDISTASYDSVSFSTASQDTLLRDIAFNSDGTAFYMIGTSTDTVYQYSLSTAYDISTASYDSVSFDVSTQIANPFSFVFNSDGTKMLVSGSSLIQEYTLSTGFDLSTASASSVSYADGNIGSAVRGLVFNDDGTKLYWLDINTVFQYSTVSYTQTLDLSTGTYFSFDLSGPTTMSFSNPPASGKAYAAQIEISGGDNNYSLSDSLQLSSLDVANNPVGLVFKPDGYKLFVVHYGGDDVDEYHLTTAYDISTATYNSRFAFGTLQGNPRGLYISPDGLHMYINDTDADALVQYSMAHAWDVSTASFVRSRSISAEIGGNTNHGIFFKSDGTKMYVTTTGDTYQYTLSTPWQINTESYDSVSFAASAYSIYITDDGTKLFAWGSSNTLHQYLLSTAWDLSTASNSIDSIVQPGSIVAPYDALWVNPDGSKYYFSSASTDFAYEFQSIGTYTVTWPDSIKWENGVASQSPGGSNTDLYSLLTVDGGTTYYATRSAGALS